MPRTPNAVLYSQGGRSEGSLVLYVPCRLARRGRPARGVTCKRYESSLPTPVSADLAQPHGSFAADGMPASLDRSRRKLRLTSEERELRRRVTRLKEVLKVTQEEMCESLNELTEPGATVILGPHLSRWLAGKEPSNQQVSKLLDAVCPLWADARETEANAAGGVEEVERQRQQEQQDQQGLLLLQQQECEQQRALLRPQVLEMLARACPGLSQHAFWAALKSAQCGEGVVFSHGQLGAWLNGNKIGQALGEAAAARLDVVLKAWLEAKEAEVAAAGGAGAFERQQAEKIEAEKAAKAAKAAAEKAAKAAAEKAAKAAAEKAAKAAAAEATRAEKEEKEAEKERVRAEKEAERERDRAEKEAARAAQAETSGGDERAVRKQRLRGGLKAPVAGPFLRYFIANLELMRSEAWQARMWAALAAQHAAQPNKTLLLQLTVQEAVLVHQPTPLPADSPLVLARARSQVWSQQL